MIRAAWITVDPAFGQNAWNDESAVAVHVIPNDGCPMTVCVSHGQWDEVRLFEEVFQLAEYWNAWVWGVEAIAAQRLLLGMFNMFLTQRLMMGRAEILPLMAGRGDPKSSRIRAWVALMANKEWAISEGDLDITNQIMSYDFRKKDQEDDIIDSCAYGPSMHEQYSYLILAKAMGVDWETGGEIKYGTEVCGV
jgi:hypothetical protein